MGKGQVMRDWLNTYALPILVGSALIYLTLVGISSLLPEKDQELKRFECYKHGKEFCESQP